MAEDSSTAEGVTPDEGGEAERTAPTADDVAKLSRALERERELRKGAEDAAKQGAAAAKRLAELEENGKTETEKAVERARREAAAEAERSVTDRFTGLLLRSTVLARATASFADPEDALSVDLEGLGVGDDGSVDTDEVDRRLGELLKRKPHWAKAEARRFGDVGVGPRDVAEPVPTDPRGRIALGLRNSTPSK